jgi:hypothetical protein
MQPSLKQTSFKRETRIRLASHSLYATKAIALCPCGPVGHVWRGELTMALQSRGPWLTDALCCRSGSLLTMASSETVQTSQCLIFFVHWVFALRSRMGWFGQVPQFAPRICNTVPPSVPRRSHRMHMVVSSPMIIAFAIFALAQQPLPTRAGSHAGGVTRLQSSLNATARCLASPTPARTFTIELSPDGSPHSDVDYNYTAYNQLPQPVFHRQDTRPYGLRAKTVGFRDVVDQLDLCLFLFIIFAIAEVHTPNCQPLSISQSTFFYQF